MVCRQPLPWTRHAATYHIVHGFKLYATCSSSGSYWLLHQTLIHLVQSPKCIRTVAHDPEGQSEPRQDRGTAYQK